MIIFVLFSIVVQNMVDLSPLSWRICFKKRVKVSRLWPDEEDIKLRKDPGKLKHELICLRRQERTVKAAKKTSIFMAWEKILFQAAF